MLMIQKFRFKKYVNIAVIITLIIVITIILILIIIFGSARVVDCIIIIIIIRKIRFSHQKLPQHIPWAVRIPVSIALQFMKLQPMKFKRQYKVWLTKILKVVMVLRPGN